MTNKEFGIKTEQLYKEALIFAKRLCYNDEDLAKDIIQEANYKCLRYLKKYDEKQQFKSWYFTSIKNLFIDNYRNKKRQDIIEIQDYHMISDFSTNIDFDKMFSLIDTCTKRNIEPFTMFYQGYKYHEISEILDIPEGTVKNRIFQAKQELIYKINKLNKERK